MWELNGSQRGWTPSPCHSWYPPYSCNFRPSVWVDATPCCQIEGSLQLFPIHNVGPIGKSLSGRSSAPELAGGAHNAPQVLFACGKWLAAPPQEPNDRYWSFGLQLKIKMFNSRWLNSFDSLALLFVSATLTLYIENRLSSIDDRRLTTRYHPSYDTIRDAILTCARKPTRVSLIYRTEPTTIKCKNREKLKVENRYARK